MAAVRQSNLFPVSSSVIELKAVRDMIFQQNKNGTADMRLAHEAFRDRNGILLFYSPRCVHCQNFAPAIAQLASMGRGVFPVGAVDCTDLSAGNDILADALDITGYPTVKYYNSGALQTYNGPRTAEAMLQFLTDVSGFRGPPELLAKGGRKAASKKAGTRKVGAKKAGTRKVGAKKAGTRKVKK